MSVSVLNTDAGLSGKTLVNLEDGQTVTGAKLFDRDPNPPFSVSSGSAVVPNLDADKVDGVEAAAMGQLAVAATWTAAQRMPAGAVGAPGLAVGAADKGLYASGTDALEIATKGIKALGIDSTQFIDSPTQPRCRVYSNANQSLADATATALAFQLEEFDIGALHDTAVNNSRITIPTGGDGLYLVGGYAQFATNATGLRSVIFKKNGVTTIQSVQSAGASGTNQTIIGGIVLVNLVATDYLELFGFQSSTAALNVEASQSGTAFWAVKLW